MAFIDNVSNSLSLSLTELSNTIKANAKRLMLVRNNAGNTITGSPWNFTRLRSIPAIIKTRISGIFILLANTDSITPTRRTTELM